MSRTNHDAKVTHEARAIADAKEYRRKIEARDANRQLRESIREYGRRFEFCVGLDLPATLAALT